MQSCRSRFASVFRLVRGSCDSAHPRAQAACDQIISGQVHSPPSTPSRSVSPSRTKRTVRVPVAGKRFTLHGGQSLTLSVPLDANGRALLARFGRKLPAKLVVTVNTTTGMRKLATRHVVIKARKR